MPPVEGSTIIGKSVSVRGELSGDEDLYIDGNFQGVLRLPVSRLTVGPHARVNAELHVRDLVVHGSIEGNVNATGRVELRQTAIVSGDIVAGRLSIEEGAQVGGRIELTAHALSGTGAASAPVAEA